MKRNYLKNEQNNNYSYIISNVSCGKTDSVKKDTDKRDIKTKNKDQTGGKNGRTGFSGEDYTVLETAKSMDWLFGKEYKEWKPTQEILNIRC